MNIVKALEWEEICAVSFRATAIGLRYYAYRDSDDGLWHCYTEGYQPKTFDAARTLKDAKAAAQADYEQRIMSALDPDFIAAARAMEGKDE